jgi:hypothetical protein
MRKRAKTSCHGHSGRPINRQEPGRNKDGARKRPAKNREFPSTYGRKGPIKLGADRYK